MTHYFDTSAFLKLFLTEPGSSTVGQAWENADEITSSSLLYVEARAALAAAMRAGRVPSETVSMTLHQLEISWEDVDEIDYGAILIKAAGDVAEFYALRGYDAMPLTSAMRVAADTFVTADRDLIRAARIHGLEVIDVSN